MKNIRNFSIIAHIDHGKSTLSDRIIQICNGLNEREMSNQVLDSMDLERERGITIKAQSVTLFYKNFYKKVYQLNFIDTPGHIDFSYEVSRSLSASEGVILLIDATQGIEAQTLTNCYAAIKKNIKIIPVINKIDLPTANPNQVAKDIEEIIGIKANNIICCSAKTGLGVLNLLEHLVNEIPSPTGDPKGPLQALIIDSWFDNYLGIISLICIKNGTLNKGDKIKIMSTSKLYNINRLGIFTPKSEDRITINCGEIGWISCAIKNIFGAPVGDTITLANNPSKIILTGFEKAKPQVYAGLFPTKSEDYKNFSNAIKKLSLNDSSLFYEKENSIALGLGFRCGFLGLLHLDIIKERLEREYNLNIIITSPTVIYEIKNKKKNIIYVDSPSKMPSINNIIEIREPIAECYIITPIKYLGNLIKLCIEKRGIQKNIKYYGNQVKLIYDMPMAEIVLDFFDKLKSLSKGYASLDYNFKYFKKSDMVKINLLINEKLVDAFTLIVHRSRSIYLGRKFVNKLQKLIPRQQFNIAIQAVIGNNIIARANISQLRKNVLAKCYGGDISRKKKLLYKQKEGKKRLKNLGNIQLPKEAFLAILNIEKT